MSGEPVRPGDEFRFHRLQKPEEFRALEEVQRTTWGLVEEPPLSTPIQRAIQDNGGIVLGAFADVHLAGFALGFLGWDGTTLYHYSHLTAVRPEYQNHRLGYRLKLRQREEVLQQGLPEVRWVFDPLRSRNALLALRRLGARLAGYKVHYFGQAGSELERGLQSDRVGVRWELSSSRVEDRLGGKMPTGDQDLTTWRAAGAIVETEPGETGLRRPSIVAEPAAETAHLEIPFDLDLVRTHDPDGLRIWRNAVRDAFRASFDLGYQVDDFAVLSIDHERRSFYFLSKAPRTSSPSPPSG